MLRAGVRAEGACPELRPAARSRARGRASDARAGHGAWDCTQRNSRVLGRDPSQAREPGGGRLTSAPTWPAARTSSRARRAARGFWGDSSGRARTSVPSAPWTSTWNPAVDQRSRVDPPLRGRIAWRARPSASASSRTRTASTTCFAARGRACGSMLAAATSKLRRRAPRTGRWRRRARHSTVRAPSWVRADLVALARRAQPRGRWSPLGRARRAAAEALEPASGREASHPVGLALRCDAETEAGR